MIACNNPFCRCVGAIGFSFFDKHRKYFYGASLAMTVVSLALSIAASFAISEDGDIVKNVAWATGELTNVVNKNVSDNEVPLEVTLHIGLSAVVQESTFADSADQSQTIKWDDVDTCGADYCEDCKDTATGTISTAIIACVTKFPAGGLMVKRRVPRTDCYFFKFMSMVSTFVGLTTLVSSLLSFSDDCWTSFPESIEVVVVSEVQRHYANANCIIYHNSLQASSRTCCLQLIPHKQSLQENVC